jgi:hypothetical protein
MDDHPWSVSLFTGHGFSRKRGNKPHLQFHMTKAVLRIYRMMLRMVGFGAWMTDFRSPGTSRCFGASCSAQRSIQQKYTSSLVSLNRYPFHFISWGIIIEDGLSISVWKTGQFVTKIYNWKSKKVKCAKRPPAHFWNFTPRFFLKLLCAPAVQGLAHVRVSKKAGAYSEE